MVITNVGTMHFLDEVRTFYDVLAPKHHGRMGTDLTDRPVERDVLAKFAELVGPGGSRPGRRLRCPHGSSGRPRAGCRRSRPVRGDLDVMSELRRVLVPGGFALLGFQVGDDTRHVTDPDGSDRSPLSDGASAGGAP